jgi:DNA invertase Pin-like site-specific DNA recombinase
MIKRLNADKEVEGIIVASLSRLGRSMGDVVGFVYRLRDTNRVFISIRENCDMTTKEGRMFFNMMASINEYERELIAERTSEGRAYAEQHGSRSGKPCHRPERVIDWDQVQRLRDQKLSWSMISRVLAADPSTKVSHQTLINQARKRGMKID